MKKFITSFTVTACLLSTLALSSSAVKAAEHESVTDAISQAIQQQSKQMVVELNKQLKQSLVNQLSQLKTQLMPFESKQLAKASDETVDAKYNSTKLLGSE